MYQADQCLLSRIQGCLQFYGPPLDLNDGFLRACGAWGPESAQAQGPHRAPAPRVRLRQTGHGQAFLTFPGNDVQQGIG